MVYLHVLESCSDKIPSPADSIESLHDLPSNQLYKDSIQSEIGNTETHEMVAPSVKPQITRNKGRHFAPINRMSSQITSRINHKRNDLAEQHIKPEDSTRKPKPSMLIPSFFSNGISDNDMVDKNKTDKTVTDFSLSLSIINSYTSILGKTGVSSSNHGEYLKWLRFYHHFCRKYKYQLESENSLQPFLAKLESKNNSNGNLVMAKKAVELFLNLLQTITVNTM